MKKSSRWCRLSIPPTVPVVVSIFLMACSQVGTVKSMGIYLEDISASLGTTPTDIGVALGLFTAFSFFPAPLISSIYRVKWMRRLTLITGSILISLGVILTSCATNNFFIATFLAIAGLGQCMLLISSNIALDHIADGQSFNRLYGLGMSGFGLGMVLLPYAADILGRTYGWRGGLLILGGLMANLVPCAMAIQPGVESSIHSDSDDSSNASGESGPSQTWCTPESETSMKILEKYPCGNRDCQNYQKEKTPNHPQPFRQAPQEHAMGWDCTFDRVLGRFRSTDYYTDPLFNLLFAANFIWGMFYCGWHAFLVPRALQKGYSVERIILLTLFSSIGNFSGRLLATVLCDRITDPIIIQLSAAILNASAILCDVFFHNYYVMTVSACLTAAGLAGMAILLPLSVRKRSSPGTFDVAFAICECVFGLGTFLGGYLSGNLSKKMCEDFQWRKTEVLMSDL